MAREWSDWRRFPDPRKLELLIAPFGPGCYELRNGMQLVLFGKGNHVAERMASLLPPPYGCGTRNNQAKRKYVFEHELRLLPRIDHDHDRVPNVECRVYRLKA